MNTSRGITAEKSTGNGAEATMHWFRVWSRPAPRALSCSRMLAEVRHDLLGESLELALRLIP
jgi:hypothetical protein